MRSSFLAVLLLTACGTTTQFAATNPSPRPLPARPAESVTVFATGLPNQPFVEVGIIQARQSSEFSADELPQILAEMRVEAGRRGCDGLVINGTRDSSSSTTTVSHHSMTSSSKTLEGFWGACIVFVEPAPALAQGPAASAISAGPAPAIIPASNAPGTASSDPPASAALASGSAP